MPQYNKLYIGGLGTKTKESELERAFSKFGKLAYANIKSNSNSGTNYAFVEFLDDRDAEDAIKGMDGSTVDGVRINVQFCHGGRKEVGGACFNCGSADHWARDCTEPT
eukprot:RCo008920